MVEIWPGGYWTEILAPCLRDRGRYYLAMPQAGGENAAALRQKLAAYPALYGKLILTEFGRDHRDIAPAGSVDLILTFPYLHNWMAGGYADAALAAFALALKPGGVLGIEDDRARADLPQDPKAATGSSGRTMPLCLPSKPGCVSLPPRTSTPIPGIPRTGPKASGPAAELCAGRAGQRDLRRDRRGRQFRAEIPEARGLDRSYLRSR